MNKVVLIGRLTKDPELRFAPTTGKAVTSITVAVDRRTKNKDGKREADFINVIIWGAQAEATANYMTKGRLIAVSGRLQTRVYEGKDGIKRYITEVIADEIKFLDWKKNSESNPDSDFDAEITPEDDGDIPF